MIDTAHTLDLQDTYLVATPLVAEPSLRGALIMLYQHEAGTVSGLVINKPEGQLVSDYLVQPGPLGHLPVWSGGPIATDRLIAVSQTTKGLFITDRILSLPVEQLQDCLIVAGQCVWTDTLLIDQIDQGAWVVVKNNGMVPRHVLAADRVSYVMGLADGS